MPSEEIVKQKVFKALEKIRKSEITFPKKLQEYYINQPANIPLEGALKKPIFNPKYMPYDYINGFGNGIPKNTLRSLSEPSSSTDQVLTPAMQTRNTVLGRMLYDILHSDYIHFLL